VVKVKVRRKLAAIGLNAARKRSKLGEGLLWLRIKKRLNGAIARNQLEIKKAQGELGDIYSGKKPPLLRSEHDLHRQIIDSKDNIERWGALRKKLEKDKNSWPKVVARRERLRMIAKAIGGKK